MRDFLSDIYISEVQPNSFDLILAFSELINVNECLFACREHESGTCKTVMYQPNDYCELFSCDETYGDLCYLTRATNYDVFTYYCEGKLIHC